MPTVIFSMMNPGIGELLCDVTLMECPCMSCYTRAPRSQISHYRTLNSCLFYQLSCSGHISRLTGLDTPFDQLQTGQWMFKSQDF